MLWIIIKYYTIIVVMPIWKYEKLLYSRYATQIFRIRAKYENNVSQGILWILGFKMNLRNKIK